MNTKRDTKGDTFNLVALSEIPDPPFEQALVDGAVDIRVVVPQELHTREEALRD